MSGLTRKLEVLHEELDGTLLKVAFATTDRKTVNQHFGSAKSFSIYAVNQDRKHLLNISEFGELKQDGNEDKLAIKMDLLEGCTAVYCRACGASAVKQLIARGVQPVKVSEGALIDELIEELQAELREGPSSWLAKAVIQVKGPNSSRFEDYEMEGWEE